MRDEFGAILPGKTIQRTDTFDTEKAAKARLLEVEYGLAGAKGIDPSGAKAKANTVLGVCARQYLDSLVGIIDASTIEGYEKIYRAHIGPVFDGRPVASITTAEVTAFRAQLPAPYVRVHGRAKPTTAPRPDLHIRSPKTVKHIVGTLKRILDLAQDDQAIAANPVIANRRRTTKRTGDAFKHRPLTANQVASVVDWISKPQRMIREAHNSSGPKGSTYTREGNQVYALAILFAAHTGVRAAELQGLQVQDVTLSDIPGTVGSIRVVRTATRKNRVWAYGTPKSDASADRVVPLTPWLADELRDYLTGTHPFAGKHPHAPLFPGRRNRYVFDWAKPVCGSSIRALPAASLPSTQPRSGPLPRFAAHLRHHEPERGRALHAGKQVVGTLHVRPDADHIRGLHQ
nr:site-specific integrase [Mycolicibacterium fluoranthenivorans]